MRTPTALVPQKAAAELGRPPMNGECLSLMTTTV
jgi:hypothetical protein